VGQDQRWYARSRLLAVPWQALSLRYPTSSTTQDHLSAELLLDVGEPFAHLGADTANDSQPAAVGSVLVLLRPASPVCTASGGASSPPTLSELLEPTSQQTGLTLGFVCDGSHLLRMDAQTLCPRGMMRPVPKFTAHTSPGTRSGAALTWNSEWSSTEMTLVSKIRLLMGHARQLDLA
jgi:hypothetical protein